MTKIRNITWIVITIVVTAMMLLAGIGIYKAMWFGQAPKYNEVRLTGGEYVQETNFVMNERKVMAHHIKGDSPIMVLGEYAYYEDGAVEAKPL